MLKKLFVLSLSLLLISKLSIFAATTATATVTYTIGVIDGISVSGNPGPLNITTATPGSAPTPATDNSTTYAITTNGTARNITGTLTSNMPTGVTLTVNLAAPSTGSSAGAVALSTVASNLVSGVASLTQSGLGITYVLSATTAASQVASGSNTVTFTFGP